MPALRGPQALLASCIVDSPVGPLQLTADDEALVGLHFGNERPAGMVAMQDSPAGQPILERAARQLAEYFDGTRRAFDVALHLHGTSFQQRAWIALTRIPYGQTRSYREQAESMGRPTAVRAVGAANHRNPISIIVPCHRVIGADGALTGFGGGLQAKRWLLEHEGCQGAWSA